MKWKGTQYTYVWVFPVGRGNAAFVRTGMNHGFMLDMGAGGETSPAEWVTRHFLKHLTPYQEKGIAQAVLSHPHADHITECGQLDRKRPFEPRLLTCPHDKEPSERLNWRRIANPSGTEELVNTYRRLFEGDNRKPPLQTIQFEGQHDIVTPMEYGLYYLRPPFCERLHADDNEYGNSTSIMVFVRHGPHTILFPGDMTPAGMECILGERPEVEKRYTVFRPGFHATHPEWHRAKADQPSLRGQMEKGLTVLVAPHHGLESCYSESLYKAMRGGCPRITVLSERRHRRPTDGKTDGRYYTNASGVDVVVEGKTEPRRTVSTTMGHHILIVFGPWASPEIYMDQDPERLLRVMTQ